MKEQHNKNTTNKIVYFALTSAAETLWGCDYGNTAPSLPFPSFFFFVFCLPLLAPLIPLWWSCGSSEGSSAAGISPEHKAPWEEQTLAHLRGGPGRGVCMCVRPVMALCAYTQECCHTRLIKTSKVRNVKLKLFTDMLPQARSLYCDLNANQDVCLAKNTEACQTSGGPTKPMTQSCLCTCCCGNQDSQKEWKQREDRRYFNVSSPTWVVSKLNPSHTHNEDVIKPKLYSPPHKAHVHTAICQLHTVHTHMHSHAPCPCHTKPWSWAQ